MTKTIHLYGAVLLLLVGQTVLGAPQRIRARNLNECVQLTSQSELIKGKVEFNRGFPHNAAVAYCNGR